MSDSVLERHGLRPGGPVSRILGAEEPELGDEFGCYGLYRGVRERAVMLELIKRDGRVTAIGYAWIHRMEYDPKGRILLHAGDQIVTIVGRNLNRSGTGQHGLFALLTRHRVPWLRELDRTGALQADESEAVIDSIG
ncbi:MAG: hypothetical protein AB7G17_01080 [Phycisphaerales bacterium]